MMFKADETRTCAADGLVAAAVFLASAPLIAFGWSPVLVAAIAAGLPALVFVVWGHAPGRGAAAGGIVLTLGSLSIGRVAPGMVPWADLVVLGVLIATAHAGAAVASRFAVRPELEELVTEPGRWVRIVVECEGPSDTAGNTVRQPRSPRRDPERRRRERLAQSRREPVTVGA